MDQSWARRSQCVKDNPFGSFRQNGSFPASLISGSVTSRHLGAPPSDYTSSSSEAATRPLDDSTHLYINMLDRSDLGAIKSYKFWGDSVDDDATEDDPDSEFSGIYSDYDDDAIVVDNFDHRGHMD